MQQIFLTVLNGGKNLGKKIEKPAFVFMYVGQNVSMKSDIAGEKAEFAYPGTILKFLECICAQDVAAEIRDTAFKVSMEDFYRELKLPAF